MVAGSETTPDRPASLDEGTGLIERLSPNSDGAHGGGGAGASGDGAACAKCGTRSAALKSCSRCLQVAYCCKECQRAAWKGHKNACRDQEGPGQQLSLDAIRRRILKSEKSHDWSELLRWEDRIDELIAGHDRKSLLDVLVPFATAYEGAQLYEKAGPMWVRCAEVCGAMEVFSEQVSTLDSATVCFLVGRDLKNAALWLENARDISKEQGFVSMESRFCLRLGHVFAQTARKSDGVAQQRRALAVAESVGEDDASHDRAALERAALRFLVEALCGNGQVEEAEAVLTRLQEGGGGNNADCWVWNHYLRGVFHFYVPNHADAARSFRAAVDVAEKHPEILGDENARYALGHAKINLKACEVGAGDAPSLAMVALMVKTAMAARDWPEVLRWESRLEELLTFNAPNHPWLIHAFAKSNFHQGNFAAAAGLFQRRVHLLGKLESFTDQGADMCVVGHCLLRLNDAKGAETWYQKARKLGADLGCYETECRACLGMGRVRLFLDQVDEAEELLRNALTAFEYVDDETLEGDIKQNLAQMLLNTGRHEEAGPLILRLRETSREEGADPFEVLEALRLGVYLEVRRRDGKQARVEMQALEDAFQSMPEGAQKALFEPGVEQARKLFKRRAPV